MGHDQNVVSRFVHRRGAGHPVRYRRGKQYCYEPRYRIYRAALSEPRAHAADARVRVFGLGTMAGTCAIAVFTFAYVGKQLFEIIETVDMGPYEAMEALGATRLQAFTTAVFPQVLPTYLSVSLFCLEGNVRYASILGYVGAGGLGLIMNEKIGWREYDSLGMILIVLFVTVIVIEALSHWLRKRLT